MSNSSKAWDTVLAVGAGGVDLDIFPLVYHNLSISLSVGIGSI